MTKPQPLSVPPTPDIDMLNKPVSYLFVGSLLKTGKTDQVNIGDQFMTVMLKEHVFVGAYIRSIMAGYEVYIYGGKQ